MLRYLVIEVGCLECSFAGTADAGVVDRTDSLETAISVALDMGDSRQVDRFIVDTHEGDVISPNIHH